MTEKRYPQYEYSESELRLETKGLKSPVFDANNNWTGIFKSSDPNKPPIIIKDIHIDPSSDIFDPNENYVGLIVYLRGNKNGFPPGGVHCRTGDIYITQSKWILKYIRRRRKRGKYVHGRLFYSIFGCWKKKRLGFVGAGFSYYDHEWKFNSGTLNTMNPNNDDTYHNSDRALNKFEEELVLKVVNQFYENHRWTERSPEDRISFKELFETKGLARTKDSGNCGIDLGKINYKRKLHGTVKWFDYYRGYGFIKGIGLHQDIFVHCSNILPCFAKQYFSIIGAHVEFNITNELKGWQATNVKPLFRYYLPY